MPDNRPIALDQLPATVSAYLESRSAADSASGSEPFTADATVVDDGHTHVGTDAVTAWMGKAVDQYTYTTTPISAEKTGEDRYTVAQHLEGDFPGGEVDLYFRFTLRDGLIQHLVIEP
ncbi:MULTISPECIES: nuclear transport factor 2 family protein [unclassified Nocardiopsis]|uniref:nuclear transport factor 2 family protein n=1 Tax=unclassified Nocardiopsis TaxID=2649073 RepID=UPI00135744E1|nr:MULTISPECIES: nuclear transport factor 2 family protein [unclassified Nocardiopsis]